MAPRTPLPATPSAEPAAPTGPTLGRRRFLAYVAAGAGLTMVGRFAGSSAPAHAFPQPADVLDLSDILQLSHASNVMDFLIRITPENRVYIETPKAEVGQGITTAMAMIVAEELDARLADVDSQLSPAEPDRIVQLTGGSNSIILFWTPVRLVAALLRTRIVTAAADALGVPAGDLVTRDTAVHAPDGRSVTYAEVADAAARVTLPDTPPRLKDEADYTIVGTPTGRLDARDIVTGRAAYAADRGVGQALPTVVKRPPQIKAPVRSFDDTAARAMPGVIAVTEIPTGIAVTAETFDIALRARDAIRVDWGPGALAGVSDAEITEQLEAALVPSLVPTLVGDVLEGRFAFPYVSHAPLETNSATADVRADSAEVWAAAKSPIKLAQDVAEAAGLPVDAVTMHVVRGGGSFGRKLWSDAGLEAAQVSKAIGRPVRLMWDRNDDMRHSRTRPASVHVVRALLGGGRVLRYEHRMSCAAMDATHGLGEAITANGEAMFPGGFGQSIWHTTQKLNYDVGPVTHLLSETELHIPTSAWRSVYSGASGAVNEMMIDEIARALGRDPVEYRLAELTNPRMRAVVEKVAEEGGWGGTLPEGVAQGVAVHDEYKAAAAYLVEIDTRGPEPRVTKAVCAADIGKVINPTGAAAQLQGCLIDGLSVMLRAGLHVDDGAIREGSYADFRWARMRHAPIECDVHLIDSGEPPGGAGELGVPAASGAVGNAWARATGRPARRFPLMEHGGA
jgi:isoquinoline 1-oxidoreductase subunit beta